MPSWLIFFLLRLPSLFEPYWYGDEGIYLALGQGIRHGLTLYSQIHDNKPPTLYYLAALSPTVFYFRLLLLLWMIPTVYFFSKLAKKFLAPKLASWSTLLFVVLTSIPLLEGNIANAEIFMLLPTILAVLFLFKNKVKLKDFFFSGFLLGFAFTIKVPVAIEFAFLFLWILALFKEKFVVKLKNLFIFTLAFFLPIFLYLLYFASRGALNAFLFSALFQNFGYLSSWASGSHQSSLASGGLLTRGVIMLFLWLLAYLLCRRQKVSREFFFISAWFFAALMGALLPGRPYPHYLIQLLPPLCLLLFYFKKYFFATLLTLFVFAFSLFRFKFYYYPVFSYYKNFIEYVFTKDKDKYYRYFGSDVPFYSQISTRVQQLSRPGDRLYIWGNQAQLYPLSGRLPATKYLVAYHVADFKAHDLTISQLKTTTPKLIVYFPDDSRSFPALDQFISRYYFLSDSIGPALIYQLRR